MKKVLSVACALCMTTAMLTGCGSSNNAGTAATGEAQNSAAASTTTEQASTATDARNHSDRSDHHGFSGSALGNSE